MSEHTPGEWTWEHREDGIKVSVVDGFVTARFSRDNEKMRHEAEANARLMAAAPEMYELVKQMMDEVGAIICGCVVLRPHEGKCRWCRAHTLIAKIDGEEKPND